MKLVTKEDIKRETDDLPDTVLDRLHKFITSLKGRKSKGQALPSFNLGGKFDNVKVRSKAYE